MFPKHEHHSSYASDVPQAGVFTQDSANKRAETRAENLNAGGKPPLGHVAIHEHTKHGILLEILVLPGKIATIVWLVIVMVP